MSITAKDLAKLLNLSEAAVSMALNNKPGVSTQTRKRVFDAAKEYGYDFTRIKAPISANSTSKGTIFFIIYLKYGTIVSDTPFFSSISLGIDLGCKRSHYHMNIYYLYEEYNIEEQLNDILASDCKGIIVLGTEMTESDYKHFSALSVPYVMLDTYFENATCDSVVINNVQGAYLATTYIISKCKSQPGYLHSSYPINNFAERADGFYKAVRKSGMSTSKSIVHHLSPSIEGAYADMTELLNQGTSVARCYFADNDVIAAGAMKAFRDKGYQIPQDVAIIGFDNVSLYSYTEPKLTTINVPKQYLGEAAVERLIQKIVSPDLPPVKIEIATSLVIRDSV